MTRPIGNSTPSINFNAVILPDTRKYAKSWLVAGRFYLSKVTIREGPHSRHDRPATRMPNTKVVGFEQFDLRLADLKVL